MGCWSSIGLLPSKDWYPLIYSLVEKSKLGVLLKDTWNSLGEIRTHNILVMGLAC
jgi:hypothetical protein